MTDKQTNTLVWIDLEMTGLDPKTNQILEIATIITDSNLAVIKEGPEYIIHADDGVIEGMHPDVIAMHTQSGLIEKVRSSHTTRAQAQQETLAFIKEHAEPNSPLCGNSIWSDRGFLANEMPQILQYLHYRIIDVSTVKELVLRWYAQDPKAEFAKKKSHRALDDIRESIAELKHYRRYFFVK